MTKKGKKTPPPAMGHDPLAWIATGSDEESFDEGVSTTEVMSASEVKPDADDQLEHEKADVEDVAVEEHAEKEPVAIVEEAVQVSEVHADKKEEAEIVLLDGDITIQHIEMVHQSLNDKLTGHSAIILDAAELQRIDTSGVQMLRVFIRDVEKNNVSLAWRNVPDTLLENATLLGLHDQMLFSNNVDL